MSINDDELVRATESGQVLGIGDAVFKQTKQSKLEQEVRLLAEMSRSVPSNPHYDGIHKLIATEMEKRLRKAIEADEDNG